MNGEEPSHLQLKPLLAYVLAWIMSWKVGDFQALAGAFSALAIGVVALLNGWVVWRDKIRTNKNARTSPS